MLHPAAKWADNRASQKECSAINNFILSYVQSCASGKLPLTECGPVWQFGVIALLLLCAILVLLALLLRPEERRQTGN